MTVSLCMVVYNEAHRIYETLLNAQPFVDEVVIADQASTDNTVELIELWAKFSNIPTKIVPDKHWGFCEPSRVKAHEASTGDWILVLDADERITAEFALEMKFLMQHAERMNYKGVSLKRSLWINNVHSWTGDYQYRFFQRNAVRYLDEIHTEPQPTCNREHQIYYPEYVGIMHTKSWSEQIRDENAYDALLENEDGIAAERKRALNVYSKLLADAGITAEQADAMSQDERVRAGVVIDGDSGVV